MINHLAIDSPLGLISLEAVGGRLTSCLFGEGAQRFAKAGPFLNKTAQVLADYFAGNDCLSEVPLSPDGTPFQLAVWRELRRVPFAETRSYGEIARRIGRPQAFRAVARACGANKLCLFIPCHRITAANGLGGFSQGIEIKKRLLALEHSDSRRLSGSDREFRQDSVFRAGA